MSAVHLDHSYSLLSGRGVATVLEFFKILDIRGEMALDGEIQACIRYSALQKGGGAQQ